MESLSALEAKIRLLLDKEEIHELMNMYPQLIIAKDWQRLADLFTENAILDFSDLASFARPNRATAAERMKFANLVFRSRAEIREFFPIAGKLDMKPFFTNHIIRVAGDEARAMSAFEHRLTQGADSVIGAGRMFDELVKVDGRWLIAYRRQSLFYFTGLKDGWADGEDRFRVIPEPELRGWEESFLSDWRGGR